MCCKSIIDPQLEKTKIQDTFKIFDFLLLLVVCDCAKAFTEDGKYRLGSSYIVFESVDIWLFFNSGSINSGRIFDEQNRETRNLLVEVNQIFLKIFKDYTTPNFQIGTR